MRTERRTVLMLAAGTLIAGCTGGNGHTPTNSETPTEDESPTQPGNDTPECDPAGVTRPPVASGTNIDGKQYPAKPAPLTDQSILFYLDDFETAFAWNRVLQTDSVIGLNIDNLDGFTPEETGDGYLASSGIRVTYTTEDETTHEREYVANYFVSPGPVYRFESSNQPTAPRDREETQLVQCGADE